METPLPTDACTLRDAVAEKERLVAEQAAEIERLKHRIRLLEKMLFGPRSERIVSSDGQLEFEGLLRELEQLNAELEKSEPEPPAEPSSATPRRRKPKRSLDELIPEDLPREDIVIDVPEEERTDPETGEELARVGEDVVEKLARKPVEYYVKRFVYPKYANPERPLAGIVRAPAPDFAVPGGSYDESFLAGIVFDKCAMHLPLYRQEERLRGLGIQVGRSTLCRLYLRAAETLRPLYDALRAEILDRGVVFTDDTPVRLQVKGKGKTVQGRMWVYVGGGNGPPLRVFEFTVDRRKIRPAEFLKGFRGYIHADAYKGYESLFGPNVRECACWMHIRRQFFEAEDGPPKLREEVLRLIRMIYRYERVLAGKPDETVVAVRRDRVGPVIDTILKRTADALCNGDILPSSGFAKAIGYLHNRGDAVRTFLGDARLRPDNGESERAIRPLAIGRKNWLFAGSKTGGDATGILLSLVQTCRAVGVEPFAYLEDVLRRVNGHPAARIDELLPHNWAKADTYYG
jgi:transposase